MNLQNGSNRILSRSSGQAVVHALQCEGIEAVFGIVGSHVVDIYDALADVPSITPISPRHEVGATFMAAAYARASGRTGVCITTAGPGVLNALNGLGQARFSALPVVMIAGGVPLRARSYELHGLAHETYTLEIAQCVAKHATRICAANEIPAAISNAFSIAASGRPGPVYVEIPWNLFDGSAIAANQPYPPSVPLPARFAPEQVVATAKAAASAARVALVLDKMVLGAAAASALLAHAREQGWVVCTTRDAMSAVPFDDVAFGGVLHDHKFGRYAFERLADAQICVAIGFDRNGENLGLVDAAARGKVFQLCTYDEVTTTTGGHTLDAALQLFIESTRPNEAPPRMPSAATERPVEGRRRLLQKLADTAGARPIHFGYALSRLDEALQGPAIIVHDTGGHEVWARSVLPPTATRTALGGANWGTMGHAIPTAAGARAARRSSRIVCITGDGCLLMSLMDLPTLIELGGPTLIVNLNDSEYGMITKVQSKAFGRSYATELPRIDYAAVARELGASAVRVSDPALLDQAFADALRSDRPWFIDVIARSDPPYPDFSPRP